MDSEKRHSVNDPLVIADRLFESRVFVGTARYPSPSVMKRAVDRSGTQMITVSLRRHKPQAPEAGRDAFSDVLASHFVLPNTAGCTSAKDAIVTARMAREFFQHNWIKLEVTGDDDHLTPDPFGLVEAAQQLVREGFVVLPYMSADLVLGERLLAAGCAALMPLASPIGTGQGLRDPRSLIAMRQRFPKTPLIVDAGIGKPSHACEAMELGMDAVLLNTAIAKADDPVQMAEAFRDAVQAGRKSYQAGAMPERSAAVASTPQQGLMYSDS